MAGGNHPLISCLMPTRNRKRFVAESVARFTAQDWPNKELIIIEDGDEDSGDLLEFGAISYYKLKERASIGMKLNAGILAARGEIISRWDDDDFYAPNRLSLQHAHMQLSGKPFCGVNSAFYYREGDPHGYEFTGDPFFALGFSHFIKRDWLLAHPYPDSSQAEDRELSNEAHRLGDLSVMTSLPIGVARTHEANTSPSWQGCVGDWMLHGITVHGCDNWRVAPLDKFAAIMAR